MESQTQNSEKPDVSPEEVKQATDTITEASTQDKTIVDEDRSPSPVEKINVGNEVVSEDPTSPTTSAGSNNVALYVTQAQCSSTLTEDEKKNIEIISEQLNILSKASPSSSNPSQKAAKSACEKYKKIQSVKRKLQSPIKKKPFKLPQLKFSPRKSKTKRKRSEIFKHVERSPEEMDSYESSDEDSCSGIDLLIDSDQEVDIDKKLEENAIKNHLSALNVKSILQEVIKNSDVQDMLQNTLVEGGDKIAATYEPKMTRSKFKEVMEQGNIPHPWPISPLKRARAPEPSFLDLQFSDDDEDDDDEYNPEKDREMRNAFHESDEDSESVLSSNVSDFGSPGPVTPSTPGSAYSLSELSRTPILMDDDSQSPMGPPPVPKFRKQHLGQQFRDAMAAASKEEDDKTIACRTRSKLPLVETTLTELEASFVAPDITTDMYETFCDNSDWKEFLQSLNTVDDKPEENGDDDNDPEYNYLAEAEAEADASKEEKEDEFRYNKTAMVTKKELNELMDELLEAYEEFELMQPDDQSVAETVKKRSRKTPAVSQSPKKKIRTVQDVYKIPEVTSEERLQLQDQLRKHLQLLTQMHLHGVFTASSQSLASCSKQLVNELKQFADLKGPHSVLNVCNLGAAVETVNAEREVVVEVVHSPSSDTSVDSPKPQKTVKRRGNRIIGLPNLPEELKEVMWSSSALMYPELLPHCGVFPYMYDNKDKIMYTPAEDNLIALGLQQYDGMSDAYKYMYMRQNILPTKTVDQLKVRTKNQKSRSCSSNPIKYFKENKKAPDFPKYGLNFTVDMMKPPKDQELTLLPEWCKTFQKAKQAEANLNFIIMKSIMRADDLMKKNKPSGQPSLFKLHHGPLIISLPASDTSQSLKVIRSRSNPEMIAMNKDNQINETSTSAPLTPNAVSDDIEDNPTNAKRKLSPDIQEDMPDKRGRLLSDRVDSPLNPLTPKRPATPLSVESQKSVGSPGVFMPLDQLKSDNSLDNRPDSPKIIIINQPNSVPENTANRNESCPSPLLQLTESKAAVVPMTCALPNIMILQSSGGITVTAGSTKNITVQSSCANLVTATSVTPCIKTVSTTSSHMNDSLEQKCNPIDIIASVAPFYIKKEPTDQQKEQEKTPNKSRYRELAPKPYVTQVVNPVSPFLTNEQNGQEKKIAPRKIHYILPKEFRSPTKQPISRIRTCAKEIQMKYKHGASPGRNRPLTKSPSRVSPKKLSTPDPSYKPRQLQLSNEEPERPSVQRTYNLRSTMEIAQNTSPVGLEDESEVQVFEFDTVGGKLEDLSEVVDKNTDSDDTHSECEDLFGSYDSQNEEDFTDSQENEDHLADLMAASTTIRFNKKKPSAQERMKTKVRKRKEMILATLDPDLIESDPLRDDRDTAFAQAYVSKVKDALKDNPDKFEKFLKVLYDFGQSTSTPVKLYKIMVGLLKGYPDLIHDFAGFLLPEQAVECGCFMANLEFIKARSFLRKLEKMCERHPSHFQKIMKIFSDWNKNPDKNQQELKEQISPMLKSIPHLLDEFSTFFDYGTPPESMMTDFEIVNLEDSDQDEDDSRRYDEFEEVELPDDEIHWGTKKCLCMCHSDDSDISLQTRQRHCRSCGLKVIDGRLYFQVSSKALKPVKAIMFDPITLSDPPSNYIVPGEAINLDDSSEDGMEANDVPDRKPDTVNDSQALDPSANKENRIQTSPSDNKIMKSPKMKLKLTPRTKRSSGFVTLNDMAKNRKRTRIKPITLSDTVTTEPSNFEDRFSTGPERTSHSTKELSNSNQNAVNTGCSKIADTEKQMVIQSGVGMPHTSGVSEISSADHLQEDLGASSKVLDELSAFSMFRQSLSSTTVPDVSVQNSVLLPSTSNDCFIASDSMDSSADILASALKVAMISQQDAEFSMDGSLLPKFTSTSGASTFPSHLNSPQKTLQLSPAKLAPISSQVSNPSRQLEQNSQETCKSDLSSSSGWCRESDTLVLVMCKEHGARDDTFQRIAMKLQNKTPSQVSERFRLLMSLVKSTNH